MPDGLRRDRRRRRAQRADLRRLPRARPACGRCCVEARADVGGCASTVDALGARVNICNCDHIMFRTTPVIDELDLADHGLRYLDVEPAQVQAGVGRRPAWPLFHDVERTIDALELIHPDEVDGYRRYCRGCDPRRRARARDGVRAADAGWRAQAARRPPTAAASRRCCAGAGERGRRAAVVLLTRGRCMGARGRRPVRRCGGSRRHARTGPRRAHLRDAARRHVGRPVGGSGAVPASILGAFDRPPAARCARTRGHRHRLRGRRACAASSSPTAP